MVHQSYAVGHILATKVRELYRFLALVRAWMAEQDEFSLCPLLQVRTIPVPG